MQKILLISVCLYLIYISYKDIKTFKITKKDLVPLLIVSIIYTIFYSINVLDSFQGMLIGAGPFYIIAIITKGIGGGDIRIMAILGLLLGKEKIQLSLGITCLIWSAIFILYKLIKGCNGKDYKVAFAPFITVGCIVSILYA